MRLIALALSTVVLTSCSGGGTGQEARKAPSTTLGNGDRVTYQPGDLTPGKTRIVCRDRTAGGSTLSGAVYVPRPGRGVAGHGDGEDGAASIQVETRRDGTVVASCRVG